MVKIILYQQNYCALHSSCTLGNSNLVYTIIRKRQVFHALANLPCDYGTISRSLTRRSIHGKSRPPSATPTSPTSPVPPQIVPVREEKAAVVATAAEVDQGQVDEEETMEGSRPAMPAEPGTLKATLPALPGLLKF